MLIFKMSANGVEGEDVYGIWETSLAVEKWVGSVISDYFPIPNG